MASTEMAEAWVSRLAMLSALVKRVGAQRGEDDEQGHQAQDGGQRAHVAAAEPVAVVAERLAQRGAGLVVGEVGGRQAAGAQPAVALVGWSCVVIVGLLRPTRPRWRRGFRCRRTGRR